MSCSACADLDLIFKSAAKGKPAALAELIETNGSIEGIPIELIAELIRNSKGCLEDVSVSDTTSIRFSKEIDEHGNVMLYISRREGYHRYFFKGKGGMGRPRSPSAVDRNRKILAFYESLMKDGYSAEIARYKVAKANNLSVETVIDIIKERRAKSKWLKGY